ncbi:geranylgeranyl reductase family protein [Panacagrimonas perspica]|uniref:Protein CbrA n=1 Tax=Panacagrimonas perspica TaxID=381431 RepID=A0A4V3UQW7_9GAMM|nr:NAD(P)/FAD-dependent oxidoreductase [Panacagrimonas perspica]TDU28132.1 geranylgeranyl reductase family protein [Panacagrimonas perspica]THD00631.1 hypothetical protein B1810_23800 [Panacagrimonas perspica]
MKSVDVIVVGGSFAGLSFARRAAAQGLDVVVIDRKPEPGEQVHTTGLLVQEVVEKLDPPRSLLRRIETLRLYAPNLRHVDLTAPGYGFHATDTAGLMRWMADRASHAGAELRWGTPFRHAHRADGWIVLPEQGCRARWLIGADGPRSRVASSFGLDANTEFLLGVEMECCGLAPDVDRLHCFVDADLAPGYFGWLFTGVGGVAQLGIAGRLPHQPDLDALIGKLRKRFDFRLATRMARRGGLIPVGGPLRRWHAPGVVLIGDAAGLVSPLTAGGIHTAIESGEQAADALGGALRNPRHDPIAEMVALRPSFARKKFMRRAFESCSTNRLLDAAMWGPLPGALARHAAFHRAPPQRESAVGSVVART